jgi:hypothetical protein
MGELHCSLGNLMITPHVSGSEKGSVSNDSRTNRIIKFPLLTSSASKLVSAHGLCAGPPDVSKSSKLAQTAIDTSRCGRGARPADPAAHHMFSPRKRLKVVEPVLAVFLTM